MSLFTTLRRGRRLAVVALFLLLVPLACSDSDDDSSSTTTTEATTEGTGGRGAVKVDDAEEWCGHQADLVAAAEPLRDAVPDFELTPEEAQSIADEMTGILDPWLETVPDPVEVDAADAKEGYEEMFTLWEENDYDSAAVAEESMGIMQNVFPTFVVIGDFESVNCG